MFSSSPFVYRLDRGVFGSFRLPQAASVVPFVFFESKALSFCIFFVLFRAGATEALIFSLVSSTPFPLCVCDRAKNTQVETRRLFSGGPARVFSPSPPPTMGQGKRFEHGGLVPIGRC